jgi:hypothetical protein
VPSSDFSPPKLPAAHNSTGEPVTPSGTHPYSSAPTVIIQAGHQGENLPSVPVGAGSNVHGLRARIAALFRRG